MSDAFEAHPATISAAEAAETTLRILVNPPTPQMDHPPAQVGKQESRGVKNHVCPWGTAFGRQRITENLLGTQRAVGRHDHTERS
jgi:hypothetical protein